MSALLLVTLLLAGPSRAAPKKDESSLSALLGRVTAYINGPVRRAPRVSGVMAVRGGIPTDQGEDLDLRLLDRARALRQALLRPDAAAGEERALRSIYQALAASELVQALSIVEGGAGTHASKIAALRSAGVTVIENLSEIGETVARARSRPSGRSRSSYTKMRSPATSWSLRVTRATGGPMAFMKHCGLMR